MSGYRPAVGERVKVAKKKMPGTCRFVGMTGFSTGEWIGIELDEAVGKNDGSVDGKKYFQCTLGHGVFIKQVQVSAWDDGASKKPVKKKQVDKQVNVGVSESLSSTTAGSEPQGLESAGLLPASAGGDTSRPRLRQAPQGRSAARDAPALQGAAATWPTHGATREQHADLAAAKAHRSVLPAATLDTMPTDDPAMHIINAMGVARECQPGELQLSEEVDFVRSAVVQLSRTIQEVQARAEAVEQALAAVVSKKSSDDISGCPFCASACSKSADVCGGSPDVVGNSNELPPWVQQVAQQVQQEMWSLLEGQIAETISRAMQTAMSELSAHISAGAQPPVRSAIKPMAASAVDADPSGADEGLSDDLRGHCEAAADGQSQDDQRQEKAARDIQRRSRAWLAQKQQQEQEQQQQQQPQQRWSVTPPDTLRRQHPEMAEAFTKASNGNALLAQSDCSVALCSAFPALRKEQADALFDGFTKGVHAQGVDMYGFCMIGDAISKGDTIASEFADMSVEKYSALGAASQEDPGGC